MSLGDKLRQRRQEMGLTRPQLAAKICVTPSAIANYENGISTPKPDILISLINVLEVDANYIYSDYLGNNRISKIYDQALSTEEIDSIKKYRELSDEELKEMFAERAAGFVKTPTSSAENFAQAFYRRKTGAAFSKEMKRSVRAMLADYTKESC